MVVLVSLIGRPLRTKTILVSRSTRSSLFLPTQKSNFPRGELEIRRFLERDCPSSVPEVSGASVP